jgi:hypothetical protein
MIINIICIYFLAETFTTKKIKLKNPNTAWAILSNMNSFNLWWGKFNNTNLNINNVRILDHLNLTYLKFTILENNDIKEIWTFHLFNKNNDYILYIKKQSLSNNNYINFINKYISNKKDLDLYCKNLNQAINKLAI